MAEAIIAVVVVECFAWFSEKPCLFIATSEGSLSLALISDLLPVGFVVVIVCCGGVVVAVDDVVAVGVVGVCARLFALLLMLMLLVLLLSLSSALVSASLSSC